MLETLLRGVRAGMDSADPMRAEIIDDSDAIASWSNDAIAAVVFPTPDALAKVEALAQGKRLALIVNPQWTGGQVISDFGVVGFGRRRREAIAASFAPTYRLATKRISGEDIRCVHTCDAKAAIDPVWGECGPAITRR